MTQWAVAVTRPNYERLAEEHLKRQGFETYLPRFRERIFVRGRACYRQQILFRRYIFVQVASAWHAVQRSFGVVGLLCSGNKPAVVSQRIIMDLKARDTGEFVRLPRLRLGQKVRVTEGPFAGRIGLYQGMTSRQREAVLLTAIGCRLELSTGSLSPV